nr:hypothetical protein [Tanacetum cinerariifolium]
MNFMDQSTSLVAASDGDPVKLFNVLKDSGDPYWLVASASDDKKISLWQKTDLLIKDKVKTGQARTENCSGKRCGSIYGFLPSTNRVLDGIFLILMMYTYALILGAECLKKGSETLLIHSRKQDIATSVFRMLMTLPMVVMVIDRVCRCTMMGSKGRRAISHRWYGMTTSLASGTFELHSIGWIASPFTTVRSEVFIYGVVGPLHSVVTVGGVDKAFGVCVGLLKGLKTRIRAVKFIGQAVSAENNATLINNSDDNSDEIVYTC